METIFIKRFIKTEDDLPKENGNYIVCFNKDIEYHFTSFRSFTKNQSEKLWLNCIDWYLQPTTLVELIKENTKSVLPDTDFHCAKCGTGFNNGICPQCNNTGT